MDTNVHFMHLYRQLDCRLGRTYITTLRSRQDHTGVVSHLLGEKVTQDDFIRFLQTKYELLHFKQRWAGGLFLTIYRTTEMCKCVNFNFFIQLKTNLIKMTRLNSFKMCCQIRHGLLDNNNNILILVKLHLCVIWESTASLLNTN